LTTDGTGDTGSQRAHPVVTGSVTGHTASRVSVGPGRQGEENLLLRDPLALPGGRKKARAGGFSAGFLYTRLPGTGSGNRPSGRTGGTLPGQGGRKEKDQMRWPRAPGRTPGGRPSGPPPPLRGGNSLGTWWAGRIMGRGLRGPERGGGNTGFGLIDSRGRDAGASGARGLGTDSRRAPFGEKGWIRPGPLRMADVRRGGGATPPGDPRGGTFFSREAQRTLLGGRCVGRGPIGAGSIGSGAFWLGAGGRDRRGTEGRLGGPGTATPFGDPGASRQGPTTIFLRENPRGWDSGPTGRVYTCPDEDFCGFVMAGLSGLQPLCGHGTRSGKRRGRPPNDRKLEDLLVCGCAGTSAVAMGWLRATRGHSGGMGADGSGGPAAKRGRWA